MTLEGIIREIIAHETKLPTDHIEVISSADRILQHIKLEVGAIRQIEKFKKLREENNG